MELNLKLKGSEQEICRFLNEFVGETNVASLLAVIEQKEAISCEDCSEDPIYKLLNDVSWKTFYLCHLLVVLGKEEASGKGGPLKVSYKILEERSGLADRSIGSRIGGAVKVAERLGIEPIISTKAHHNERYCHLSAEAVPIIEQAALDWKTEYADWLEDEGAVDPRKV